jgi:hypothetical protein
VCKNDNQSLTPIGSKGEVCLTNFVGPSNLLLWIDDSNAGYCRLVHMATGKVLDGDGVNIHLNESNSTSSQQWKFDDAGDGYQQLIHMESGNVLTAGNNGSVSLSAYNQSNDNQKWSMAYQGYLVQKATERVMTRQDEGVVILAEMDDPRLQIFYFEHVGSGDYKVCYNMFTPDVMALGITDENDLCFDTWQGLDTQKWKIEDAGDGFQKFTLKSSLNQVLDGNGFNLYIHEPNGGDYQLWSPFVRMAVDRTKPYNEITFAMAHDSHTDKKTSYYSGISGSPSWEDQTQDVGQQLTGGIRAVRISTGLHNAAIDLLSPILSIVNPYFAMTVILQHTVALKTFADYLERVREFLDRNPTAILTIYDEGDSSLSPFSDEVFEMLVAKQYADTFGGTPEAPRRVLIPGVNGMPALSQLEGGTWPTIQEMLEAGVQIVVVMSHDFPKVKNKDNLFVHPWILPAASLFSANPYDNLIQDADMTVRPACVDVHPTDTLGNKLFKFNHFFYSPIAGKEESSQALNIWSVGDLLIEDTLRAWAVNQKPPNWINVDFYQGVQEARSYLTHLVRAINSSATLADLEKKVKGCYIQNTNGRLQIGHPYTTDADTPRYQIINKKADGNNDLYALNLQWSVNSNVQAPYVGVGLASLSLYVEDVEDNAPSQYWYLRYNLPPVKPVTAQVHGIQFVMAWGTQFILHSGTLPSLQVSNGAPNMTSQAPDNIGHSDTGWEIFYDGNTNAYLIRQSGNPKKVLGIMGEPSANCQIALMDYNANDMGQRWTFKPVNATPYPPFLPLEV